MWIHETIFLEMLQVWLEIGGESPLYVRQEELLVSPLSGRISSEMVTRSRTDGEELHTVCVVK